MGRAHQVLRMPEQHGRAAWASSMSEQHERYLTESTGVAIAHILQSAPAISLATAMAIGPEAESGHM